MLVLTRKTEEQVLIGNDIKITLIRVRGNSVRIGIDAPRDVRIIRGELEAFDSKPADDQEHPLSGREEAFAHPQPPIAACKSRKPESRFAKLDSDTSDPVLKTTTLHTRKDTVRPSSDEGKSVRAPLASFVSAI